MALTLTEIRRRILESVDPKWFESIEEKIEFTYLDVSIPFKGVSSIYDFALKQREGWEKLGSPVPRELEASKAYFNNIVVQIEDFISAYSNQGGINLDYHWKSVKNAIRNTSRFPLKYNCPETEFLLKVFNDYPNSFTSAFCFITKSNNLNLQNRDALVGGILAYEFMIGDSSKLLRRSIAEKKSIKNSKMELEQYFSDAESELTIHLNGLNKKYSDSIKLIDELKNEKEKSIQEWFNQTKSEFNSFNSSSTNNIKALETAYAELLSLKKPAEYWKKRAIELKTEGWKYLRWLIFLITLTCVFLFTLLWITPEEMLRSFFKEDKSLAIRWALILITLISFLAFGIKALTKVTFSAFHLARDAEERERLTYVYLAMIKDASVDKEDRHLIMQSLFSRAETGLLKDDSSPTMPGASGILDKFIK